MINDIPVIDAVVHSYNLTPENCINRYGRDIVDWFVGSLDFWMRPGYVPPHDQFIRDWAIEDTAKVVFLESETDIGVYHTLPLKSAFHDGYCSFEKAIEAQERWPHRFVVYGGVDPLAGDAALEELERQVEVIRPTGLKLYPSSFTGNEARGWHMDNPEFAFPLFERAQQLGVKVIAVHKAVPVGAVPMEHYHTEDVASAAIAFPDLNFEIVHGGVAFMEETAMQLATFPNIYVNLETTSCFLHRRPRLFHDIIVGLMGLAGEAALRKIVWGTGAMAVHPQPALETFVRDFQISDEQVNDYGIPQITDEHKRWILFDNFERMSGLDLRSRLSEIQDDEFSRVRIERGLAAAWSTISQLPGGSTANGTTASQPLPLPRA